MVLFVRGKLKYLFRLLIDLVKLKNAQNVKLNRKGILGLCIHCVSGRTLLVNIVNIRVWYSIRQLMIRKCWDKPGKY